MSDHGSRYTDRRIRKVDRELQGVYRQAEKELKKKLANFVSASKVRDRKKQLERDSGLISEQEYKDWLRGQVFQKKRWERKIRSVQQVMYNHNVEAAKIVNENKLDVFAENYDFEAFKAEWITGISFEAYSAESVSLLLKDRPELLPKWKVDQNKDYKWNYRKVNNAITQGIIQGESVDKIAQRLINNLCTQNENKMRMFARTALTEAQSAGRQAQMQDAAKKGIEVHKQWLATLDMRTRDTHRHLDGQEVPYNKPFDSDLGKIMFPGDPEADPANAFNCRCTVVTIYPEYEDRENNWREDEIVDGMTYEEWKIANSTYINDYRGMPIDGKKQRLIDAANSIKVEPIEFERLEKQLTTKEIAEKISQFDKTEGSCTSVALAYIANKAGYDVYDFRGGSSEILFSMNQALENIAKFKGVKSYFAVGLNDYNSYDKLSSKMKEGKEYLLSVGQHVAIVKRTPKRINYLELQAEQGMNGYKNLTQSRLDGRFGCREVHLDYKGNPKNGLGILIDIDTLKNNDDFLDIVRYINKGRK